MNNDDHRKALDISRRNWVDKMMPSELAILNAQHAVDDAGADPRLTEASTLLEQARNKVADWVDGVNAPPWTDEQRAALTTLADAVQLAVDEATYEQRILALFKLTQLRRGPR